MTRELVYRDGNSAKFWRIELNGASHTVTYGRIGSTGQTKTKDFADEAGARTSHDKLVAAKLKKGYVDDGDAPSAPVSAAAVPSSPPAVAPPAVQAPTPEASPAAVTEAPEPPPPAPVIDGPVREIDLAPLDWYQAPCRHMPPLTRGTPRPFDHAAAMEQLGKLKTTSYGWETRWQDLKLPSTLSREEAHFWLLATTARRGREHDMKSVAAKLAGVVADGNLGMSEIRGLLGGAARRWAPAEMTLALAHLISPLEYLELMCIPPTASGPDYEEAEFQAILTRGFRSSVVPYLGAEEAEALRAHIRANWDSSKTPASHYDRFPAEYYAAAALGMHDEIHQIVSQWQDDRYAGESWHDHYDSPQELLIGLATPELVAAEWQRLKLRMRTPEDLRAFLACTEFSALDYVADCIIAETNKDECQELMQVFCLVRAPEAAGPMLRCRTASKAPALARDWLDTHVGIAVAGLVEIAGGRGNVPEAALTYLRTAKRKGHADLIEAAIRQVEEGEGTRRVRSQVLDWEEKVYEPHDDASTPAWLAEGLQSGLPAKLKKLPDWATAVMLPPLIVAERRLSDAQIGNLLQVLANTPVTERRPLFAALREQVAEQNRDEFAWQLFQLWREDGAVSEQKWAMGAIGHLGDDGCVLQLTPLIRAWPGESQHARAVLGLECLRAIGSSTALMQLSGIAQKLKFKGLKTKARQFVDEIAEERGMTKDELEDRVVPECGLDEDGRREFCFGPRSFTFVLGGDLKANVRDEQGKVRPNLPKPGARDDAEQADRAVAEWKGLKKQIKEVATLQAGRLEHAMVTGRRWPVEDFEQFLVRHPLMTHLAQKLIWAGFDATGQRVLTFRVTEERDYADPNDDEALLTGVASVGIVHTIDLPEAEAAQWGEVLSDYEIVSPFPQLGRAVYTLAPGEETTDDLRRFHGLKLHAPTLVFTLERMGWIRGEAMDAGCFDEHSKQFFAAGVTAVIGYEGTVAMGYIDPDEMLTTTSVHFCKGMRKPSGYGWGSEKKLALAQIPPIVISEVLADLHVIKGKAK